MLRALLQVVLLFGALSTASAQGDPSATPEETEKYITAEFGSKGQSGLAGCKTEELSKKAVQELRSDCKAWMKDQKDDLKTRYITGSCDEFCEPCAMSLKRCSVLGKVRYTLKP